MLGLAFAHCTSSISDGLYETRFTIRGHEGGSDVCRHRTLVSDARRLMFCFACIACLACSLHFRPQRPDYNRERGIAGGPLFEHRHLRRETAPLGANVRYEHESTLVKILEVTSNSKDNSVLVKFLFVFTVKLTFLFDWLCSPFLDRFWKLEPFQSFWEFRSSPSISGTLTLEIQSVSQPCWEFNSGLCAFPEVTLETRSTSHSLWDFCSCL